MSEKKKTNASVATARALREASAAYRDAYKVWVDADKAAEAAEEAVESAREATVDAVGDALDGAVAEVQRLAVLADRAARVRDRRHAEAAALQERVRAAEDAHAEAELSDLITEVQGAYEGLMRHRDEYVEAVQGLADDLVDDVYGYQEKRARLARHAGKHERVQRGSSAHDVRVDGTLVPQVVPVQVLDPAPFDKRARAADAERQRVRAEAAREDKGLTAETVRRSKRGSWIAHEEQRIADALHVAEHRMREATRASLPAEASQWQKRVRELEGERATITRRVPHDL
ncbi:hypothetical protein [Brevibacterium litoralis]|uniref:hypothetical protein n=1 Tax=Brevibacterium litoralis TaxID=3138935 RepID=UPI0032EBFA79